MPIEGNRIPVKLPFKGATDNSDQFVSMKAAVASFLKLKEATPSELEYETTIDKKDPADKRTKNPVKVKRRRRPGFRQRAVKITFKMGRKAINGSPSTFIGKERQVGRKTYKSIQFPITKSCSMNDIVHWFESGGGSGLGVLSVTDMTSGQSYPIARILSKAN
jgi:hypothetical protein